MVHNLNSSPEEYQHQALEIPPEGKQSRALFIFTFCVIFVSVTLVLLTGMEIFFNHQNHETVRKSHEFSGQR
jgi:hypothetical protein